MIAELSPLFLLIAIRIASPAAAAGGDGIPPAASPAGEADISAPARESRLEIDLAWKISGSLPEFGHPAIDEKIRAWFNRFLAASLAEGGDILRETTLRIDYRVSRPSDRVLGVAFETSWYADGAAHPSSSIEILNFSLPGGQVLSPGRLFREPEKALAVFAELSPGLVLEKFRKEDPDFLAGLADPDDFWLDRDGFAPVWENYSRLGLESGGVRIHFGEYQVLAYAYGIQDVLLPLAALIPAGPNPEVWPAGASATP
ncbi:MAG: RsiV family protein [Planctomycetota bacterium]|jgi:hypothetical protein|nr:RsiV family protein [Planctomycetota bacterium]